MLLVRLAWRSLWRNKRRSFIAIAAIVFAVSLSIIQRGMARGTYAASIKTAVRMSTGYIEIQKIGYKKKPTLQKSFRVTPDLERAVRKTGGIDGVSPRLQADGLLSHGDQSIGVMIMGVSPATEPGITDFPTKVKEGRFLSGAAAGRSAPEIVLGYKLMENLGAKVGDSVVVLAQGIDGMLGNIFVRIVGTFRTGSDEFDRMTAFMDIRDLQEFLGMDGRVSALALSVSDPDDIGRITAQLNSALAPAGLVALPWEELLPQLKQSIELDNASGVLYIIILLAVVGFGILNTVLMSITERFREYGVMLSLGMRHGRLASVVAIEVVFMTAIGFILGNALGAGINYYFIVHPIVFGGELAELYREYGFAPVLVSSLSFRIFVDSTLTILAISVLAAVYPIWRVARLEPLKGIRYT